MARVYEDYKKRVASELMQEMKYSSPMQVPKLSKIVLNMGLGEATQNSKVMEFAQYAMINMSGQKPVVRKSKKAIASFKLRANLAIGCMVTLRGKRMYEFMDRLVSVALPRVKDFRGVSPSGFDGRGNYSMGIREQIVFPEVELDKLDKVRGLNITFVTTAKSNDESKLLLTKLGMPFRK